MTTPHKQQKLKHFLAAYVHILGLSESNIEHKLTWKPGYYINIPNDGQYVANTEPVTIEFNSTPKLLDQILPTALPIYQAADAAQLKPYINPAAERSGMGHIHIGGRTLSQSPFFKNENLLRNVLAFFHKHPSLLYGFAEAYDIGKNSNIETLHAQDRQRALKNIIEAYDQKISQPNHSNGLLLLVNFFKNSQDQISWTEGSGFSGFFAHYRFINLEHLQKLDLNSDPEAPGKQTVEFRLFRPPPTAAHAQAMANLLVQVMNYLAKPSYLEEFKTIHATEFKNYMTGSKIKADWEDVRNLIGLHDPLLDSMVDELVENIHAKKISQEQDEKLEIFEAYSEKELKGKNFELRIKDDPLLPPPHWEFNKVPVQFEKVQIENQSYWISEIEPSFLDHQSFRKSPARFLKRTQINICEYMFGH